MQIRHICSSFFCIVIYAINIILHTCFKEICEKIENKISWSKILRSLTLTIYLYLMDNCVSFISYVLFTHLYIQHTDIFGHITFTFSQFLLNICSILCFVLFFWYFVAATAQYPQGNHECFMLPHLLLPFFPSKYLPHSFTFQKDWADSSELAPMLRSSHGAGFLPHKVRVWAGRLSDPLGN